MCSLACITAFLYSSLVTDDFFKGKPNWRVCNFIEPGESVGLKNTWDETGISTEKLKPDKDYEQINEMKKKEQQQILTH